MNVATLTRGHEQEPGRRGCEETDMSVSSMRQTRSQQATPASAEASRQTRLRDTSEKTTSDSTNVS
eukprot:308000-Hanusia_phi.AAC.1